MKYTQLLHVIRAAADVSGEKSFVVIGSQAVLLMLDDPGPVLTMSDEIDLYPSLHPEKADEIDGAIGALSQFHDQYGYHADGVSPDTAILPRGWMDRARFQYFGDLTVISPEIHDLAASKCAAARDKDADFVRALIADGHVSAPTLMARIHMIDRPEDWIAARVAWAERRRREALPNS
jgi:hypothetical protein